MKKLLYILCFSATTLFAQEPVEVVQAQLDAYNDQDADAFAAVFAEDAKLYLNLGDTEPTMTGRDEIRRRYGAMFEANPENKSTLIGRMTQGNFVFD
ncbi:MAG: nuclear transport factor 2 family protein, partial [Cryomorphaceae bacterium]